MWAGIAALLQALPKIMDMIGRLVEFAKEGRLNAWINDLDDTIVKLETAATPEDKRAAARSLVNLVRGLK